MKIYALLAVLLFGFCYNLPAKVNYSFSAATATYGPVSGGNAPVLIARPWGQFGQTSITYDEGIANNLPIGFTFNYNGTDYTTINICAKGFATLGIPFIESLFYTQSFYSNSLKFGLLSYAFSDSTEENAKPILAPLWDDINCQADANLRYITTGPACSHVFTFEWSLVKWQYDAAGNTISFELKLYESTNVVEFCYRDEGAVPDNPSASIGITASDQIGGAFLSLQNTSASPATSTTTENKELSLKPANNQVYRFTPLPCRLPRSLQYTASNTSVSFSWDAPVGITNFEYVVDASPVDPASGTVIGSTSQTVASLSPGTNYFIPLRSYCSAASQSVWLTTKVSTLRNNSAAPPIAWQTNLGGSGFDNCSVVKQTNDGGYIVAATSNSNDVDVSGNHGGQDYWIVKLSSTGTIQWQKSLGGNDVDQVSSLAQTSDGWLYRCRIYAI